MTLWQQTVRRRGVVLSLCLLAAMLFGSVQAQAPLEDAMRIGVLLPEADAPLEQAVVEAARQGAVMADEEYGFNAEMLGMELEVLIESPTDAEAAVQAAERLIDEEGVFALVGGFTQEQAVALSQLAEERQVLFFNIGSSSDSLRNEACNRYAFHLVPSAAMYLDALAGWYIRSGFRRWFFVYENSEESQGLYARSLWSLRNRHFGAREVGRSVLEPRELEFTETLEAIRRANPELVLVLLESQAQLAFLEQYEAAELDAAVTGFPDLAAQTRTFFAASREAAPTADARQRASAWEATLDRYGARELNSRYLARWDAPMEPAAWTAYQAVKLLYEAAFFSGSLDADELIAHLENPQTVFDVYKGIGTSFRPWDHQLRQSLYLITISSESTDPWDIVTLVGELPAIYLPGTEPVERLDQLGDLEGESACRF